MRTIQYIALVFLAAFVLGGCENEYTPVTPAPVEVVMNGVIAQQKTSKGGQIIPRIGTGLPDEQLAVAIITVNYKTDDPLNDQPDLATWSGSTADITRGYFGGPGIGAPNGVTNGEIRYTNDDGDAVQKVFYDDNGEHYFIKVLYPYDNAEFIQSDRGAGVLFSDLDGQQDILCSNIGWGNMENPEMRTSYKVDDEFFTDQAGDSVFVLSHRLSLFRIQVVAESEVATFQYGPIRNIRLIDQPGIIKVDMIDDATEAYDESKEMYYLVDKDEEGEEIPFYLEALPWCSSETADDNYLDVGTFMVLPHNHFTIEAETDHLWLTAHFDFGTNDDPLATTTAGMAYNIKLKFMEGFEMKVEADSIPKDWWMDHEFN